jgi:hypothetical protein
VSRGKLEWFGHTEWFCFLDIFGKLVRIVVFSQKLTDADWNPRQRQRRTARMGERSATRLMTLIRTYPLLGWLVCERKERDKRTACRWSVICNIRRHWVRCQANLTYQNSHFALDRLIGYKEIIFEKNDMRCWRLFFCCPCATLVKQGGNGRSTKEEWSAKREWNDQCVNVFLFQVPHSSRNTEIDECSHLGMIVVPWNCQSHTYEVRWLLLPIWFEPPLLPLELMLVLP